jgi:hypothetical protein
LSEVVVTHSGVRAKSFRASDTSPSSLANANTFRFRISTVRSASIVRTGLTSVTLIASANVGVNADTGGSANRVASWGVGAVASQAIPSWVAIASIGTDTSSVSAIGVASGVAVSAIENSIRNGFIFPSTSTASGKSKISGGSSKEIGQINGISEIRSRRLGGTSGISINSHSGRAIIIKPEDPRIASEISGAIMGGISSGEGRIGGEN